MTNFFNYSEFEFIYNESSERLLDVISIVDFFIILLGTIGNLTCFYLLNRKRVRVMSNMRYLSILTIVDSVCLYGWFLSSIYRQLNDESHIKRLENISAFSCKAISYMSFTSLQLSSFLLCIITIDRLLIIISPLWRSKCLHIKNVNCIIIGSIMFFMILNLAIPINLGNNGSIKVKIVQENKNQNSLFFEISDLMESPSSTHNMNTQSNNMVTIWQCYDDSDKLLKIWKILHLCLYSLLPFPILAIFNSLVIYLTRDTARQASEYNKKKAKFGQRFVTRLLIFLTFSFICTTLPSTIVYAFWHIEILQKKYGRVLLNLLNTIQFSRHGLNWIIYLYSSSVMRTEFKKCFSCAIVDFNLSEEAFANRPTVAQKIRHQLVKNENSLSSTDQDQLNLYFLYIMYSKDNLRDIEINDDDDDTNLKLAKNENNVVN